MVKETLDQSLPTAVRLTAEISISSHTDPTLDDIIPDFEHVLRNLEGLETRVDRLIDRCTGEMQLAAARQSLAESHNLARLTWLATIFVPPTFVTGLFSMNENIGSLVETFRTYFAAAVPVAIIALIISRWGADILRFLLLLLRHFNALGRWV
jgi:Mg2+ and Co2+ transporter CorA